MQQYPHHHQQRRQQRRRQRKRSVKQNVLFFVKWLLNLVVHRSRQTFSSTMTTMSLCRHRAMTTKAAATTPSTMMTTKRRTKMPKEMIMTMMVRVIRLHSVFGRCIDAIPVWVCRAEEGAQADDDARGAHATSDHARRMARWRTPLAPPPGIACSISVSRCAVLTLLWSTVGVASIVENGHRHDQVISHFVFCFNSLYTVRYLLLLVRHLTILPKQPVGLCIVCALWHIYISIYGFVIMRIIAVVYDKLISENLISSKQYLICKYDV